MIFFGSLHISFLSSNLPCSQSFFHLAHVCPLQASQGGGFKIVAFESPHRCWNIHFNPLKTIVDLHFLERMGLVKCQDGSGGLDSFFAFSN